MSTIIYLICIEGYQTYNNDDQLFLFEKGKKYRFIMWDPQYPVYIEEDTNNHIVLQDGYLSSFKTIDSYRDSLIDEIIYNN